MTIRLATLWLAAAGAATAAPAQDLDFLKRTAEEAKKQGLTAVSRRVLLHEYELFWDPPGTVRESSAIVVSGSNHVVATRGMSYIYTWQLVRLDEALVRRDRPDGIDCSRLAPPPGELSMAEREIVAVGDLGGTVVIGGVSVTMAANRPPPIRLEESHRYLAIGTACSARAFMVHHSGIVEVLDDGTLRAPPGSSDNPIRALLLSFGTLSRFRDHIKG